HSTLIRVYCHTFFSTATAPTETYTLSLHDALPIFEYKFRIQNNPARATESGAVVDAWYTGVVPDTFKEEAEVVLKGRLASDGFQDRKSTRLNSSHRTISYAVFCLKKKKHHHDPRHN